MKPLTLISFQNVKSPIYDALSRLTYGTSLSEAVNPDKGIFVLIGGRSEAELSKMQRACSKLWKISLDAELILEYMRKTSGEYILVIENGIPSMEEYIYYGDEIKIDNFLKKISYLIFG